MTRFLLDSSAILNVMDGGSKGQDIAALIRGGELCTSVICFCEVLNKCNLDKRVKAEAALIKLLVFSAGLEEGEIAVGFQDSCRKRGVFVPSTDCIIAATAKSNRAILVSTDSDFSRIEGIEARVL